MIHIDVHILASGSDGNSTLVVSGSTAILIDAGLGPRVLRKALRSLGYDYSDLAACLLTHEHSDHIAGLERGSYPSLPLVANRLTHLSAEEIYPTLRRYQWIDLPLGAACQIGEITAESFATSHDAACSVGYRLTAGDRVLIYATDLGLSSSVLDDSLGEADYLVIEANHDETMLRTGPYPDYLKKRVASKRGHLSNRQTATLLAHHLTPKTRWCALAHLSRINNTPCIALQTVASALIEVDALHPDFYLAAAPSHAAGGNLSLY